MIDPTVLDQLDKIPMGIAWLAAVPGLAKFGLGLFSGLKSLFGGPSDEEKMALRQLNAQNERANTFFTNTLAQQRPVAEWGRGVLGGDISKVPTAAKAAQAYETSRQGMSSLMPRSGGAAALWNPQGKTAAAWDQVSSAIPSAVQGLSGLASQSISGMGSQSQAPHSMLDWARQREEAKRKAGGGFFDFLSRSMDQASGWLGNRGTKSTWRGPTWGEPG